jgi:ornithine lipid ester-linked acyl 2-hydroxylase
MELVDRYRELGAKQFARWVLIKRIGKPIVRSIERLMASQSLVGNPEIYDKRLFPWIPELEASVPAIRAELDRLLEHRERLPRFVDIQPDQGKINPDAGWKTFFFGGLGVRSEHNRKLCPATAAALDRIPNVELALFSILAPGLHIPRHAGVTKGLIRCHLALKVPRDREKAVMHVGSTSFHWEEGKAIVFDDTYKHEVFNDTDEERVVLLFDTQRPMRWPGRVAFALTKALLKASPFVRDSRRNHERWEKVDGGAFERPPAAVEALV